MGNIKLIREGGELFYQRFLLDCTAQKLREQQERTENTRSERSESDGFGWICGAIVWGIAFLRSVELIPARRAGVPVRDGAGEGARRRGSAGGARDQTSRSSSDVSCDGWASDSSS